MTLEEVRTYTPWALAVISVIWTVVLVVINKTFATKTEVSKVKEKQGELERKHDELAQKVELLPKHEDFASLQLSIEKLHGDIKAIQPQLKSLQRMSDLLIENEVKGDKS